MKALVIAEDKEFIDKIKTALTNNKYDIIIYNWFLKALDNIEEIAPDVIIIDSSSYPRHWKTLVSFVKSEITGFVPKIILYSQKNFSNDELKKTQALNIDGIFYTLDNKGLNEFVKFLNSTTQACSLIFTNPYSNSFVTGNVEKFENNVASFVADNTNCINSLEENQLLNNVTIKIDNSINFVNLKILSKEKNKLKLMVI